MIYKLISQVSGRSFAALVGTDQQDQFLPNSPKQHTQMKRRIVGRKVKKKNILSHLKHGLVPASHTAIGFTSSQASSIFQQWKNHYPYAFIKENHVLQEYAFTNAPIKTNTGRPFEGTPVIRRLSMKPLIMINLEKYPRVKQAFEKVKPHHFLAQIGLRDKQSL